ncbi:hypothetical protein PhCBS80983_g01617 [Powellomyces hirtus]|uniref:ATP-dependent RNA helicase DED1 n=1 Tax=Powellomyces hirtus TaxID=109895 RepID=A0A507EA73_9FUNG|nr:hypothetical protein PhCBS80983_g01617 [Powellomyces hirtus]
MTTNGVAQAAEHATLHGSSVDSLADELGSTLRLNHHVQNQPNRRRQKIEWTPRPRDPRLEKALFSEKITEGINFDKYDDIEVSVAGHDVPDPLMTFKESDLHEGIKWMLQELASYKKPTPIQRFAIPSISARRDIMACAQTGSGKTAAYLLPIISNIFYDGPSETTSIIAGRRAATPTALIMSPTRELATQIHKEALKFTYRSFMKCAVIYGGVQGGQAQDQYRAVEAGCDILIATAGKLVDFLQRGLVSLEKCRYLVLDEADRMLDMGFELPVRFIISGAGMNEDHQTSMFSATFPRDIQILAHEFMKNRLDITIGEVGSTTTDIQQTITYVRHPEKQTALIKLLQAERAKNRNRTTPYLVLIFVKTKRSAPELCGCLQRAGFRSIQLHGDMTQAEREMSLRRFKRGDPNILIATDVAQRGLDIPNVMHVIQYDLPSNIDEYVHRIGRTGRAGNTGYATSFYNEENSSLSRGLMALLKDTNTPVPSFLQTGGYGGGGYGGGGYGGGGGRGAFQGSRGRGGMSQGGGSPRGGGQSYPVGAFGGDM